MEKEAALDNPLPYRRTIKELLEVAKLKINLVKEKEADKEKIVVDKLNLNDYILLLELYNERKEEFINFYLKNKLKKAFNKELGKDKVQLLELIIQDDLKNKDNFEFVKKI